MTGTAEQRAMPVAVLMRRREVGRGPWRTETWEATGVVTGEAATRDAPGPHAAVREEGSGQVTQVLWCGLALELHVDEAESYDHNLRSPQPSLFVVCHLDEAALPPLRPILVSASQDEAGAYLEAEAEVFAVPMPAEIGARLERYVLDHYRPAPRAKRRRRPWHAGERG
ncbi:DUF3305 domain-containing protein [Inmirania thermothiophila]|uniref:Uncharacterized protein DUF3305 n=1 Tax=Inmirania thermothiophila TaxID=1750597 RepID=A0A3N1Y1D0_9GAMM|nr:DUF3305 domain-containing protein [Inmirania thermothiophila]ROR32328.1 uncharacterized protein DUF3305 [Inmirania thermothiophila]